LNGIVTRYFDRAGYGFIRPLIGKPDEVAEVWFHRQACVEKAAPPVGSEVTFDLVRGRDGRPQAANIELVRRPASTLIRKSAAELQSKRAMTSGRGNTRPAEGLGGRPRKARASTDARGEVVNAATPA
jgi:cold shock CspA family protein